MKNSSHGGTLKSKNTQLVWLWLSFVIIVMDLLSKHWVINYYQLSGFKLKISSFLNIVLTYNFGAAFSFLGHAGGWQRWIFSLISIAVSVFIIIALYRGVRNRNKAISLALILGGAVGNGYERLRNGYVTDFIDFHIRHWHYATFNLADTAICVGVIFWILADYFYRKK